MKLIIRFPAFVKGEGLAMKKLEKIGVQLWTVREYMHTEAQIKETFQKLKHLGYDQIQTAGCSIPYDVFGALAGEAGLEIVGTHDDFDMMCNDFEQAYQNHQSLHTKLMGTGGVLGSEKPKTAKYMKILQKRRMRWEKKLRKKAENSPITITATSLLFWTTGKPEWKSWWRN